MAKSVANATLHLVLVADLLEPKIAKRLHQRHPTALLVTVTVELHIPHSRIHQAATCFVQMDQEKEQGCGALGIVHLWVMRG